MNRYDDPLNAFVLASLDAFGTWVQKQAKPPPHTEPLSAKAGKPWFPTFRTHPSLGFAVLMKPDYRPDTANRVRSDEEEEEVIPVSKPLEGQSYLVLGPDGLDVVNLPATLAERCYGIPTGVQFRLRIADETPDIVRFVLDALPGPCKEPITVPLDLEDGDRYVFTVPVRQGTRRQASSPPSDPLLRKKLGLSERADVAEMREWRGLLSFADADAG